MRSSLWRTTTAIAAALSTQLASAAIARADDHGELDFMVIATIEVPECDTFVRPNERTGGFQEEACLLNRDGVGLRVLVQLHVAFDLIEMLLIIHRRGYDLAWIRYRAEKLDLCQRKRRRFWRKPGYRFNNPIQIRNQYIVRRKRIPVSG